MGDSLRLGCVRYLNARPLVHGWEGPVYFEHPSVLCRLLARGELDVALVSSFEYLRNPIYSVVDEVAIGSDGPIYSVGVAHRVAINQLHEIGVDPASETSVHLLRCLLAERNLNPRLVPNSDRSANEGARLLIGDQAIRFRLQHNECPFWDLGEEWRDRSALPFVYALWLIRPEVRAPREIADRLRALRDLNLGRIEELAATEKEFDPEFCLRYFRQHLRFTFGEKESEGLRRFQALCAKHGLLPTPELNLTLL